MNESLEQWVALVQASYRSKLNRWMKDSIISRTIGSIFLALIFLSAVLWLAMTMTGGYFLEGAVARGKTNAPVLVWNTLCGFYLFMWLAALVNEASRGDTISLTKLMHLPLSPASVFTFNYLLSWISFSTVFFVVGGVGLVLGGCLASGPAVLWKLIPIFSYAWMVTSLTSQVQGKIVLLLANPKTRAIVMMTIPLLAGIVGGLFSLSFIFLRRIFESTHASWRLRLIDAVFPFLWPADILGGKSLLGLGSLAFLPCMWMVALWSLRASYRSTKRYYQNGFDHEAASNKTRITEKSTLRLQAGSVRSMERSFFGLSEQASAIAAMTWTLFWRSPQLKLLMLLPLLQPFILMLVLRQVNSQLAVRLPTPPMVVTPSSPPQLDLPTPVREAREPSGETTDSGGEAQVPSPELVQPEPPKPEAPKPEVPLPEIQAPDPQSPQVTMPRVEELPQIQFPNLHAFIGTQYQGFYLLAFVCFSAFLSSGLATNIFGFDRSGFRFWVLSALPRSEILRGRNWMLGAMILAIAIPSMLFVKILWEYSWLRTIEAMVAFVAYLPLYLVLSNICSILAPFPMSSQGFQPKEYSWKSLVWNILLTFMMPVMMGICSIPWWIEWGLHHAAPGSQSFPIALLLMPILIGCTFWIYQQALEIVGELLQTRETELLKIVTSHNEK